MAFDGITMNAIKQELQEKIVGARIDKIYQPSSNEIVINLRHSRESFKLLLSSHPVYSRVCITQENFENPKSPPLFCMVLRKHLEGGRIVSVSQPSFERILEINIESRTELGDLTLKNLTIEVMGKHSNIILLNGETKIIIDSIKKVSFGTSQYRQVLPGLAYILPPYQNKANILEITEDQLITNLMEKEMNHPVEKALLNTIMGLSPSLANQLAAKFNLKGQAIEFCGQYELSLIWQLVQFLVEKIKNNTFEPVIFLDTYDNFKGFSPVNIYEYHEGNFKSMSSINKTVDFYFNWIIKNNQFNSIKRNLQNNIDKEITRCEKKLKIQLSTVEDSNNSDRDRIFGELLTAHMHLVQRGMDEVVVINYYNDNKPLSIKLRPELTPAENAQRYYRRYNKAKNAAKKAAIQARQTSNEIKYLESLSFWLSETISHDDFIQIEQELIDTGYIKNKTKPNKKDRPKQKPYTFKIEDSYTVLVGKNNKQNEWLTFKVAKENDIWFHAKDIPGSHVILQLEGKEPTENVIKKAAMLAAYYSKGKLSANLAVDYTLSKYVKKIKGAKPGLVTYDNYKTIFVTPEKEIMDKIT